MDLSNAARQMGRRGGLARAARLPQARRQAIAAMGGRSRSLSHHAERRIAENFRYLEVVEALRGKRTSVIRVTQVKNPLPDVARPATANGRLQHGRR